MALSSSVDGDALKPAIDWLKQYRDTWGQNYDRLDAVLNELQNLGKLATKE